MPGSTGLKQQARTSAARAAGLVPRRDKPPPGRFVTKLLHFPEAEMARLKATVIKCVEAMPETQKYTKGAPVRLSGNDVITALVWMLRSRALVSDTWCDPAGRMLRAECSQHAAVAVVYAAHKPVTPAPESSSQDLLTPRVAHAGQHRLPAGKSLVCMCKLMSVMGAPAGHAFPI